MSSDGTDDTAASRRGSRAISCRSCGDTITLPIRIRNSLDGGFPDPYEYFDWDENTLAGSSAAEMRYSLGCVFKLGDGGASRSQVYERIGDGGIVVPPFGNATVWICRGCIVKERGMSSVSREAAAAR